MTCCRTEIWFAVALILLLPAIQAQAQVVGQEGMVYPIRERDFLEVIMERIATVDQQALQKKMMQEITDTVPTFRLQDGVTGLPVATRIELYRVDLSFTVTAALAERITDSNGKQLYTEGERVNPLRLMLDRGLQYPFVLVVLNAERKAELDWFKAKGLNENPRVKLLVTDGYPYQLAEQLGRPVYQLTKRMQNQFQIKATPSLVFWPAGTEYLAVRTMPVSEPEAKEESHVESKKTSEKRPE